MKPLEIVGIFIFESLFVVLLFLIFLRICESMTFVKFTTNLTLKPKKKTATNLPLSLMMHFLLLFGLLLAASHDENTFSMLIILSPDINYKNTFKFSRKSLNFLSQTMFSALACYVFYLANTQTESILCLITFQISCYSFTPQNPKWLHILLIILSNDIHQNPGPHFHNAFFTFMSWNANSIAKDDFSRVSLIEAHNSIFNYGIISICCTSLNDSVALPDSLLNDYTFVSSNNPANTRHGGTFL